MTPKKLAVILAGLAAAGTSLYFSDGLLFERSGDLMKAYGTVDTRYVSLAFEGQGRIQEILVEEGDFVKAGDVLARLDVRSLEIQKTALQADLKAAQARLSLAVEGPRREEVDKARKEAAARAAQFDLAEKTFVRTKELAERNAASQAALDEAGAALDTAGRSWEASLAALSALEAGSRPQEIELARAQAEAARSALDLAVHQIEVASVLRSPGDLLVRSRLAEVGDMAYPQRVVMQLAAASPKFVKAYVGPKVLAHVKTGDEAVVTTDFAGRIPGRVTYVSNTAEFTPRTVQTEELRSALLYEVRIEVDDPEMKLFLGQPVGVEFNAEAAP